MADLMNTIMVVPARGGSQGIPRKNVKLLKGRPLITWVLEAGMRVAEIDQIVVTTDDSEIEKAALSVNSEKILCFRRSPETATSTATSESALLEVARQYPCRHLMLVQATSPLVGADDLSLALARYVQSGADSLLTVARQKRFIWEEDDSGWAHPVNYNPANRPRRQDFDGFLVENGAIYITDRDRFLDSGSRLHGRIAIHEMSPESYFELDDPMDWPAVEALLSVRHSVDHQWGLRNIRLVMSDIDGVLTDAGMYYSEFGDELKRFCTYDGQAVAMLQQEGILVGLITRENCGLNARRAEKMGVNFLAQDARDKLDVAARHIKRLGIGWHETAYIGDDIHDAALLSRVAFAAAPAGATDPAKAAAQLVLSRSGGQGCLRELADLILRLRPLIQTS